MILTHEKLIQLKHNAFNSIQLIRLIGGNQLVIFFRKCNEQKATIEVFQKYFHLQIASPAGAIKHQKPIICTSKKRIGRCQFFCQVEALPPIEKGDRITFSAILTPNKKMEVTFTL